MNGQDDGPGGAQACLVLSHDRAKKRNIIGETFSGRAGANVLPKVSLRNVKSHYFFLFSNVFFFVKNCSEGLKGALVFSCPEK